LKRFLLCNKDTSSDELAATFVLPEMITDQTKIEEEAGLHLSNLSLRHRPWKKEKENKHYKNHEH